MQNKKVPSQKTADFDQPGPLMTQTMERLNKMNVFEVYADTKISPYWLKKFAAGGFKNPSVNRVEFLHNYLISLDK